MLSGPARAVNLRGTRARRREPPGPGLTGARAAASMSPMGARVGGGTDRRLRRANELLGRVEALLGRDGRWALPDEVTIEPTNRCNSRCAICLPYRRDPAAPAPPLGCMAWETLERVAPLLRRARRVLFTGNGEPLLHPRYLEMARWVKARVPFVYLFTNGSLIDDAVARGLVAARVDLVSVSLGGATPESFERVRGIPLAPVLAGVDRLLRARAAAGSALPEVQFTTVALNSVLPELPALVDLARARGVRRITMPQLLVPHPGLEPESLFVNPQAGALLERAREQARAAGVELQVWDWPPRPARCAAPGNSVFVAFDGDVLSCAAERHVMGNVSERDALAIWRSRGYRRLRRLLRTAPAEICPGCPTWSGDPAHFRRAAAHDRRAAGSFDDAGNPRSSPCPAGSAP